MVLQFAGKVEVLDLEVWGEGGSLDGLLYVLALPRAREDGRPVDPVDAIVPKLRTLILTVRRVHIPTRFGLY